MEGIWGAYGVNEKNVSMTATETLTTNARVAGGDPLVDVYKRQVLISAPLGIVTDGI